MLKELFATKSFTMSSSLETINILRLIRSENVGPKTFFTLIKLFGDATSAIENIQEFSRRGGRTKPIKVFSKGEAERELELLEKNKANIITYQSSYYSRLLLEIYDLPPILSYKGNINLLNCKKCVAIVGARNASAGGCAFAYKIAQELTEHEIVTVSGLARGIDTAVHKANTAATIAIIAGGIDHIYPLENKKLFENIAQSGLIVAELPVKMVPLGQHFPRRNRLISGISLATVVIEASLHSGSLITARFALEQGRELFAVPGFLLDPRSRGTNNLIKEGAYIVESANDIVTNLPQHEKFVKQDNDLLLQDSIDISTKFKQHDTNCAAVTIQEREQVIHLLSATPVDFNYLQNATKLLLPMIYTIILELELAGRITRHPGNKISLIYT